MESDFFMPPPEFNRETFFALWLPPLICFAASAALVAWAVLR